MAWLQEMLFPYDTDEPDTHIAFWDKVFGPLGTKSTALRGGEWF